ncbi:MAG TPA: alpha/beta fold hydrolase [Pyrinomonadaceae bacterium]|nr:alpha/beta fold hydrolase [Pyrinomonadaceae bacterium]
MRVKLFAILLIVTSAFAVAAQAPAPDVAGNWLTTLEVGGTKLRLALKIKKSGDSYAAGLDSVDQGVNDLPIDSIVLKGNELSFSAANLGINYVGTLNAAGDEITGTFKQRTIAMPLVFKRIAELPKFNRPQEPKQPYPYTQEEVSYRNQKDNIKIAGTLTLPRGSGPYPVVLLITGSGSQDRNETIAGHHPFLVLADYLTRNGIAVLRVDDRGVGGTDLGSLSATSENFAEDVLAGVNFLKQRKEIDPKMIGLIGHSEGGMIAPMVAARSNDVSFIVLLAGPGQRGEDIIYAQTELLLKAQGTHVDTSRHTLALSKRINSIVKAETDEKRVEQRIDEEIAAYNRTLPDLQKQLFEPAAGSVKAFMPMYRTAWFRYFVMFDPQPVLKNVKVPVLALNGELDLQVPAKENLDLIGAGLKAGGNDDVTLKLFPKLNHLFQTAQTGLPTEYAQIDETMSPDVLKTVSDWILQRRTVQK